MNNGGCEDICTNTPGSFMCSCSRSGYRPDQSSCVGKFYCNPLAHTLMHVCAGANHLHNIMFICYTPPCIELHGIVIFRSSLLSADINECEVMQHNCTAMQERCVNIDGGFSCECESGFTGNSTVGDGCYSKLVIGTI